MRKCILSVFVFVLLLVGCEQRENHRFIIQNDSDKELIIIWAQFSIAKNPFCINFSRMGRQEYRDFIRDRMIRPHSYKNFEEIGFAESMMGSPNRILYFSVFYRIDMATMSCEEFKEKFPIRKEWRVTLADMEANDWTLVYTPKKEVDSIGQTY